MIGFVKDVIEGRGPHALAYGAPGSIVVVETAPGAAVPRDGELLVFERADGWQYHKRVADVRQVAPTAIAFFVAGVNRENLPLQAVVRTFAEVIERERVSVTVA